MESLVRHTEEPTHFELGASKTFNATAEWSEKLPDPPWRVFGGHEMHIDRLVVGYPAAWLFEVAKIVNYAAIVNFLSTHAGVEESLREVVVRLLEYFPDAKLRVELYEDPEAEMPDEIALYVISDEGVEVAYEKLESFDEEYWIERIDDLEGIMSVNLD